MEKIKEEIATAMNVLATSEPKISNPIPDIFSSEYKLTGKQKIFLIF